MPPRRPLSGLTRTGIRVLLPTLLLAGLVTGGRPDMVPDHRPPANCGSDLMHPLEVTVIPDGPIRPGAAMSASVRITTLRDLDAVDLVLDAPGVDLLSRPGRGLGRMQAGEVREERIQFVVPRSGPRRVVQVRVEGRVDGFPVSRGTVLNLNLREEPSRTVITPDGREIREVQARRVG